MVSVNTNTDQPFTILPDGIKENDTMLDSLLYSALSNRYRYGRNQYPPLLLVTPPPSPSISRQHVFIRPSRLHLRPRALGFMCEEVPGRRGLSGKQNRPRLLGKKPSRAYIAKVAEKVQQMYHDGRQIRPS